MEIREICNLIEERKNELFELLSNLVKINSESFSDYGNEEDCAKYIYNLCIELGLETSIFSPMDINDFEKHPEYMPGRKLENRYNVVAKYQGKLNEDELMLMAHIDTVRIGDVFAWDLAPLSGKIVDGKIYGRGVCDDKYALAATLFIMKILKECEYVPQKNLLFAAYSDEEYGGSHGALSTVIKYNARRIVSLDGDEGQIWHCASGGQEVKYHFHTKYTTDSAGKIAKAIGIVVDFLDSTFGENRRKEMKENSFYKGTIIPETSLRYMGARAGNNGSDLGKGEVYFVFYTDKDKDKIWLELNEIERILNEKLSEMDIMGDGFEAATRFFHYAFCEPNSEDIVLMLESSKEAIGKELKVCGSCLSDLSMISKYGTRRAFGFGAGRDFSEIGGAHQPNEFIECDKLVEFTKTIGAYILKVLG